MDRGIKGAFFLYQVLRLTPTLNVSWAPRQRMVGVELWSWTCRDDDEGRYRARQQQVKNMVVGIS